MTLTVHVPSPPSKQGARSGSLLNDDGFPLLQEDGFEIFLEASDLVPQGRVPPIPLRMTVELPDKTLGPDYGELLLETGGTDALLQENGFSILLQTVASVQLMAVVPEVTRVYVPPIETRLGVA